MGENAAKRIAAFFACAVFGRQRVRQVAVVFFRPGMVSHGTWPLPDGRAIFVCQVFFCPALPGRVSMKAVTMAMESVMQMYRQSVFAADRKQALFINIFYAAPQENIIQIKIYSSNMLQLLI